MRDVRFDLLDLVRQTEGSDAVILHLSRSDAARVVEGIQEINSSIQGPDDIAQVEAPADDAGPIELRLDETLPKGVAAIETRHGTRKRLSLGSVPF